jgi:hypothetical protein
MLSQLDLCLCGGLSFDEAQAFPLRSVPPPRRSGRPATASRQGVDVDPECAALAKLSKAQPP